jgi:hypothetical protein
VAQLRGAGGGLSTPQSKIGVPCNSCRSVDFFWRGGGGVARVGHTKILLLKLFLSCKMHQNSFGGPAPPGPAGGAHSAPPDSPAEYGGPLRGREGRGRGEGGRGREGQGEVKGKGNEGRGEGREG